MNCFPSIQNVNTVEGQSLRICCPWQQLLRTLLQKHACRKHAFKMLLQIQLLSSKQFSTGPAGHAHRPLGFAFPWRNWLGTLFLYHLPDSPRQLLEQALCSASVYENPCQAPNLLLVFCGELGSLICTWSDFTKGEYIHFKEKAFVIYKTNLYTLKNLHGFLFLKMFTLFHTTICLRFWRVERDKQKFEKMWIVINCSFCS